MAEKFILPDNLDNLSIKEGEAIAIALPLNDRQQWRSYIVYDTQYNVDKLLKYEPVVMKAIAHSGKTFEQVLETSESKVENHIPGYFYIRCLYNRYPSTGMPEDKVVQAMSLLDCQEEIEHAKSNMAKMMCFASPLNNPSEQETVLTTVSEVYQDIECFNENTCFLYENIQDFGYREKDLTEVTKQACAIVRTLKHDDITISPYVDDEFREFVENLTAAPYRNLWTGFQLYTKLKDLTNKEEYAEASNAVLLEVIRRANNETRR